jgi:hypothetical protein
VGSREHVRAEIDRLRIAASDIRQAAAGAHQIEASISGHYTINGDAERALETGVIVSYARPFTRHGIGQLDSGIWAPGDEQQAKLHKALLRLRNIRYAHTDRTDLRTTEEVFGEGRHSESWQPLAESAWPRIDELASLMAERFDELADALEEVLRNLSEASP